MTATDRDAASRGARLDEFATFPERLRAAVQAASARGEPPPASTWGPAEIVRHLIATDLLVHQPRLEQLRTEREPHWAWAEPELGATVDAPLPALLDDFAAARGVTIATIRGLDAAAWERIATHETFGALDVDGLIRIAADHDVDHLRDLAAG